MAAASRESDVQLLKMVKAYVEEYMSQYDGSHDFSHILRVYALARWIAASAPESYDPLVVDLAALMHDVGDRKYLKAGEDSNTLVRKVLMDLGADEALADKIQTIVSGVSFSSEIKDPDRVTKLIAQYPELAVVQDADRLDAIGAIGIGRAFTYGGATGGTMGETIKHFTDKLERLEGMMKTGRGKEMASRKTKKLKEFRIWWADEVGSVAIWSDQVSDLGTTSSSD